MVPASADAGKLSNFLPPANTDLGELRQMNLKPGLPLVDHRNGKVRVTTHSRRPLAATSIAALVAASALFGFAPTATAAEVCGEVDWGMKASFRKYITGPIAHGSITRNGVGYAGSGNAEGDPFRFTPGSAVTVEGDEVVIPLSGSIRFQGHDGVLDTTFSDFTLHLGPGSEGYLTVDYEGYAWEGTERGPAISGDDVRFVNISLKAPVDTSATVFNLAGSTKIAPAAVDIFKQYKPGENFDDISGVVRTDGKCGAGDSSGGSNSASAAKELTINANDSDEIKLLKQLNNEFYVQNQLTINGMEMNTQANKWANQMNPDNAGVGVIDLAFGNTGTIGKSREAVNGVSGAAGNSANSAAAGAAGNASTASGFAVPGATAAGAVASGVASGASSGTGQVAGAVAASGGATASGGVCEAGSSRTVTAGSFNWAVKESFLNYIRGSIAHGNVSTSGVNFAGGRFTFPTARGAYDPGTGKGMLSFPGAVHFTGHDGKLNLLIANPEVQLSGGSGQLIAEVQSSDMTGTPHNYGRVALANVAVAGGANGDALTLKATSVALSQVGSQAFADFYQPGTELDQFSIQATLGGAADCNSVQAQGASGGAQAGVATGGTAALAELGAVAAADDGGVGEYNFQSVDGEPATTAKKSSFAIHNTAAVESNSSWAQPAMALLGALVLGLSFSGVMAGTRVR